MNSDWSMSAISLKLKSRRRRLISRFKPSRDFILFDERLSTSTFPRSVCQSCSVSTRFSLRFKILRLGSELRFAMESLFSLRFNSCTLGINLMAPSMVQISLLAKFAIFTLFQLYMFIDSAAIVESWIISGHKICWTFWALVKRTSNFSTWARTGSHLVMFCGTTPSKVMYFTLVNGVSSKLRVEGKIFEVPMGLIKCRRNSSFEEKLPARGTICKCSTCEQNSKTWEKSYVESWSWKEGQGRRRRSEIAWI